MSGLRERLQAALGAAYAMEDELGGGGMSRVFVALDRELGRRVVVKVLPPERAARVDMGRFRREIQLAASLQHPHIVPLLTAHRTGDVVCYTMPLIKGESLRARLDREGGLPVAEAVRILRDVVDGLSHAHAQGVVHRDIKPDNVLVSGQHALVTDFGVAKALSETGDAPTVTSQAVAVGTPAYMAPEQAVADAGVDQRADIYAVGVLAYELLSGRPPFTGMTTQEVLAAQVLQPPVPLAELEPSIPGGLAALVMRCLAKKAADRWQTAAELLSELEALTTPGGGIRAWPAPSVLTKRRRRALLAAGAAGVLALAAVVAWQLGARRGATALDADAVAVLPFRIAGADPAVAILREGMVDLLAAKLTGEPGPRAVDPRTTLAAWRQAAGSREQDLPQEAALDVARRLGAGQLVLGEVVGKEAQLVVTASLLTVGDGRTRNRASVQGPIDSLTHIADQLAGQLLALGAGEPEQRLASLTSTSVPALRAYLLGTAAHRRGRYQEAVGDFQRALQLDSMFALAAVGLVFAAFWEDYDVPRSDERAVRQGQRLAWAFRERLSRPDQAILRALVGLSLPDPGSVADRLAAWEAAAAQARDQPEVWFHLGNVLYRDGPALGVERAHERAVEALRRAVALDSTFAAPLGHLVELAATEGDTASVRRLGARYVAAGPSEEVADYIRWRIAVALGDSAMLDTVRARLPAMSPLSLERIMGVSVLAALPQEDADRARVALGSAPGPRGNLWAWGIRAYEFDLNRGRLGAAGQILESLRGVQPAPRMRLWLQVLEALYADGDSSAAAEAVRALEPFATPRAAAGPDSLQGRIDLCVVELWRLRHGDTRMAARAIATLRGASARGAPYPVPSAPRCAQGLEAMLAHVERRADAEAQLARFDSTVASQGPRLYWMNLEVARLYEAAGDLRSALAVLRRRPQSWARTTYLSSFLREEGRLAALVGDRAGTIRAYRHYLALRPDPDPVLRPAVEHVRAELAKLLAEQRAP